MVRARLGENNTRITDDPTYMKNYMKAYYNKHFSKAVISATCSRCGFNCSVQKLKRHQDTKLCKKRGDILNQIMLNEELEASAQIANEEIEFKEFKEFKEFLDDFVRDKIKSE
jgi:reverse gyrase